MEAATNAPLQTAREQYKKAVNVSVTVKKPNDAVYKIVNLSLSEVTSASNTAVVCVARSMSV